MKSSQCHLLEEDNGRQWWAPADTIANLAGGPPGTDPLQVVFLYIDLADNTRVESNDGWYKWACGATPSLLYVIKMRKLLSK